jgi:hypothetical protein
MFEKLLPYAMALGLEKRWAAAFNRPCWGRFAVRDMFAGPVFPPSVTDYRGFPSHE